MDLDSETEWDLQSIRRYEKLLMFEAEYPARQMELLGVERRLVCLGDKRRRGDDAASSLTVFGLPPRLGRDNDGASLSPHFDLKIVAGTFSKNRIHQIACAGRSETIVASELEADRLHLYTVASDQSDKLIVNGVLCCGLIGPRIAASSDTVMACGQRHSKVSIIDLKSGKEIGVRHWTGAEVELAPLLAGPNTLLVYSREDATAVLYDTRQPGPAASIQGGKAEGTPWTAGCGYEEGTSGEASTVAFLSGSGEARFHDLKQPAAPTTQISLGSMTGGLEPASNNMDGARSTSAVQGVIKVNPLNSRMAAAGGLDSRIYVLETEPSCCIKFVHDGHEHMESCLGSDTRTIHHVFYSPGGDRALISSADNSSINCWSYNPV